MEIAFNKTHEEYLLQMFEYFFKKDIKNELSFDDNGYLLYDKKKQKLHWLELTIFLIPQKLFDKKIYWETRFYTLCVHPLTKHKSLHCVEYLYEKFLRFKSNLPFGEETQNDFSIAIEENAVKKEERKEVRKNKDKISKLAK